MRETLYIAAKAPRIGLAKTRLGKAIGHAAAVTLYRAFLQDIVVRFEGAPFEIGWFVTPDDAWDDLGPLVGRSHAAAKVLFQGDGDWTERQRDLFRLAQSDERVILLASDSPHVSPEVVADAFRQLDHCHLVLGPVYDGGYYLLGMRGWHDVLRGVRMSTGAVLRDIRAHARSLKLSVAQVEATFDVDVVDDLEYLRQFMKTRDDLPATRKALMHLGLIQ